MSARVELKEIFEGKSIILEEEVVEAGKVVKPMKIGGVASKGNVFNKNGRYYSTGLWETEAKRLMPLVEAGKFLGELDHPDDGKSRLSRTAIKYTKLFTEGDLFKFEADVLETHAGKDLKAVLRGGASVDISTRGFGSTKRQKVDGQEGEIVQKDFELVAIDAVAGHSNLDAEINYFQESKQGGSDMDLEKFKKDHPDLVEAIVKETEERVRKEVTKEVTDKLTNEFENKILDEIAKNRDDIVKEVTAEVKENLVPKYEEFESMLGEIADIVKDFIGESQDGPPQKDEQVSKLEARLDAVEKERNKLREDLGKATEKIDRQEVKEHLEEVLKNEPFKAVLKERLGSCKTKEEVDQRIEEEKSYVNKIVQLKETPSGTGHVDDQDDADKKKKQLTEDEKLKRKQQRLAGIAV